MKPTRPWMEKTLREWQASLGLVEWKIELDWSTPTEGTAIATCRRSADYLEATIIVEEAWRERSREEWEQTLVHELLHVHLRGLARAHDFAIAPLGEDAANVACAAWGHHEEAVVERLAVSLVAMKAHA